MKGRPIAITATTVVAVVAAIVSYDHMRVLATNAGESWKAFLIPLAIDGMVVAASTVLLARRRAGQPGGVLAWLALLGGVLVSLMANAAAAQPTLIGRAVALVPPLALAVSFELVRSLITTARAPSPPALAQAHQQPGESYDLAEPHPGPGQQDQQPTQPHPQPAEPHHEPGELHDEPGALRDEPDDADQSAPGASLEDRATALVAAAHRKGHTVGRTRLARELGITEHQARQLLATVGDTPTESSNGHRPP